MKTQIFWISFLSLFLLFSGKSLSQIKKYKPIKVIWQAGRLETLGGPSTPGDTISTCDCTGMKFLEARVIVANIEVPEEAYNYDRIIFSLAEEGSDFLVNPFYEGGFGQSSSDVRAQMTGQSYFYKHFGIRDYCKKEAYVARIYVSVQTVTGYKEEIVGNALVKKPRFSKAITIAQSNPITLTSKKKKD
jgi:hypothetical protein